MGNFENKTVIVTGGGGHIGRAIAVHYLQAGANVIICGRREPKVPVSAGTREALFVQADIRDPLQSQRVVDAAVNQFGGLDVLVNNAGGSPPVAAAEASPELTQKIIQLNLVAPLVLAQQAYRVMAGQQQVGSIINIASVSGTRPSPGTAAYGSAKAGLLSATKSLAQEWGPKVRVNAIVVGLVRHDAGVEHYGGEEGFARVANMLPLKRMAEPQDIADACLFLSSEQAAYISGASLEVDGGGEAPVFLYLAANK
ncbi:MAG: SDR family oxidoreductase [Gammaproteobacteria bacterium]|uniref:SDR family oxidoreductase n=1 Tax=Pseudomaricurvus alcaniphilus TaxID=1166482 RepID=UPI0014099FD2|nr:SDR family oxidoreductase [Pseudomaricurvus alcaniphilus]MBR9913161.1 SDR family oxidoreductase [Gammaproteobacteria bacterium]NHN36433.1 SDR family oxidoreductase [Pseudomaricurvus alcaniphilus]